MVAWRQPAEFACQYLGKGRMVVVEGKLTVRDWTDKDGNKRRNAEIIADNIYFGDSKKDNEPQYDVTPQEYAEVSDEAGELPF